MKRRTLFVSATAAAIVGVLGVFQNCSKVSYSTSDADLASLSQSTPLQIGESESLVSARNVPPLKLFFIVDNSYTMKANNLNLSRSFAKMFAAGDAGSLARFDTTTYLVSTAQRAPAWGSSELKGISDLQLKVAPMLGDLGKYRTPTQNAGVIPGDNIGYWLNFDGTKATFTPAPVLGTAADGSLSPGIRKLASEDGAALSAEFQRRLGVLDSGRIPLNADGTQQNQAVLDAESGLCATARILRNNAALVNPGEQAAFVIVSDEDENNPGGSSCVQTIENVTTADNLINGHCDERSTVLTYAVPSAAADTCKIAYKDGYYFKYAYTGQVKVTKITYRKQLTVGRYTSPTTTLTYFTKTTAYTKPVTVVNYYTKQCTDIVRDGVVTGQNCQYPPASGRADGDQRNSCVAAAVALSGGKVVQNDPKLPITCPSLATASCAQGQAGCVGADTYFTQTPVVDGTISSGSACVTKAQTYAGAILNDPAHPISCAPAAPKTGDGACPASLASAGCAVGTPATYADTVVQVDGDFSAAATCQAKAKSLAGGAGVDADHPATCAPGSEDRAQSPTGTLSFAAAGDGGKTAVGDCGALKAKIAAQVSGAPTDGTCTITGYRDGAPSVGQPDANSSCAAAAQAACDAGAGTKTACAGTFVAGAKGSTPTVLPAVTQEVACSDPCAKADGLLCASAANVTVDASTTIAQYLVQRYGPGTTCSVAVSNKSVSTFVDRKVSDQASLCVGKPGVPQYLVKDDNGATHQIKQVVTDFVVGTAKTNGAYAPRVDLATYVNERSQDLFGAAKPILSVLVRTSADGTGAGGSIGTTYDMVAKVMGGRTDSVMSSDYSSSLGALSGIINARLQRSFVVADMKPSQAVKEVLLRKAGSGDLVKLLPSQWSAAGNNVTIDANFALAPDDTLRFRFF